MCCCDDIGVAAFIHYGPTGIPPSLVADVPIIENYATPCSPFCLQDEDEIHPKVNAEKYFIDNDFVDEETGLVRVGLEVFVQPVTDYVCTQNLEVCNSECIDESSNDEEGACCFCNSPVNVPDFCVDDTSELECNELGGEFQGEDTNCGDQRRTNRRTPDGELIEQIIPGSDPPEYEPQTESICNVFCDVDLSCEDDPCQERCEDPIYGACCTVGGCSERTKSDSNPATLSCDDIGGRWQGDNTVCEDVDCRCDEEEEDVCDFSASGSACSRSYAEKYAAAIQEGCDVSNVLAPCLTVGGDHCTVCPGGCCAFYKPEYESENVTYCSVMSQSGCESLGLQLAAENYQGGTIYGGVGTYCNTIPWPGDYGDGCGTPGSLPCLKPDNWDCCYTGPEGPSSIFDYFNSDCVNYDCFDISSICNPPDPEEGGDPSLGGTCCINGRCAHSIPESCCGRFGGVYKNLPCGERHQNGESVCGDPEPYNPYGSCCKNGECNDNVRMCDCIDCDNLTPGENSDTYGDLCDLSSGIISLDSYEVDSPEGGMWSSDSCACRKSRAFYPTPYCPSTDYPLCDDFISYSFGGIFASVILDPVTNELIFSYRQQLFESLGIDFPIDIGGSDVDEEDVFEDQTQVNEYVLEYIKSFLEKKKEFCCAYDYEDLYPSVFNPFDPPPIVDPREDPAKFLARSLCRPSYVVKFPTEGFYNLEEYLDEGKVSVGDEFERYRVCDGEAGEGPCQPYSVGGDVVPEDIDLIQSPFYNSFGFGPISGWRCSEYHTCGFEVDVDKPCVDDEYEPDTCQCDCHRCIAKCVEYEFIGDDGEPNDVTPAPDGPVGFSHCNDLDGRLGSGLDDLPRACPPKPPQCFDLPFEHVYTANDIECVNGVSPDEDECQIVELEPLCTEDRNCYSEPFVGWKKLSKEELESPDAPAFYWNHFEERNDGITQYLFDKIVERFGPQRLPSGKINPYPAQIYFSFDPTHGNYSDDIGVYPPWEYVLRNLYEKIRDEYDSITDEEGEPIIDEETGQPLYYDLDEQVAFTKFYVSSLPSKDLPLASNEYYPLDEGEWLANSCNRVFLNRYGITGPSEEDGWPIQQSDGWDNEYPSCRGQNQERLAAFTDIQSPEGLGLFDYMTSQIDLSERHYRGTHCVRGRDYPEANENAPPEDCQESICNPYNGGRPREP
jgi:hypothetical protein